MFFRSSKPRNANSLNLAVEPGATVVFQITNTTSGPMVARLEMDSEAAAAGELVGASPFDPKSTGHLTISTNGKLSWGPGGNTAMDTNFYRASSGVLQTDQSMIVNNNFSINGTLTGGANVTGGTTTDTLAVNGHSLHMKQGNPSPGPPGGGPGTYTPSYESQMSACMQSIIDKCTSAGIM